MADCPSGKVRHRSQAAARRAAIAVGQRRTHDRPRIYQCPDCHGGWHLSSAPRYTPTRSRRRPIPQPQPASPAEVDAWFAQHAHPEQP